MIASVGLRLQILGPLRIWRDGIERDPGPRRQAYLLALLLARAGRPVATSELISLIWGEEPPTGALNVVQKYVGGLRRLLEPGVEARRPGSYVQRRGTGYQFVADREVLDVLAFRHLADTASTASAERRPDDALTHHLAALGLWRGPAGEGLLHAPAAIPTFAALDREFFATAVSAAELAITVGQPHRVLPFVQRAATMAPLHEPVQAALITTLAVAGRQAEALAVFQRVRARLADDLGIDPGPALESALQQALSRTVYLAAPPVTVAAQAPAAVPPADPRVEGDLVGRDAEAGTLRRTIGSALAGGSAFALVEGEPGAGKTRLLEEAARDGERRGARVVWGHCLAGDGTPSMWPWVQAVGAVIEGLSGADREKWLAGELGGLVQSRDDALGGPMIPENDTRFRLYEQVVAVLGEVSAGQPLVLLVDDLHWADLGSLRLFAHLVIRLPRNVAVIGAFRSVAPVPGSALTRVLAAASRTPGHRRIRLGPLGPEGVAELVRRETGQAPGRDATRIIHTRTAGNPFFVLELSRLLAEQGVLTGDTVARAGVPATVRDVVHDRMAGLDDHARGLLRIAAIVGRDVELSLLARAAGVDVQTCLNRLEPVEALGLLGPAPGNPLALRFAHDLVRESVAGSIPRPAAPELHLRVANALEQGVPGDDSIAERLAHHLCEAGPLAGPGRTAISLIRAGRRAAAKSAVHAAERHLRKAARLTRAAGLPELELSALALTAAVGMQSRYGAATLDVLERAEHLVRDLGREAEATGFLFSRWLVHATLIELDRSGPVARRLLEQGRRSEDPTARAYGLRAWGLHQWHIGNIGESFRYLTRSHQLRPAGREEDPVRYDVELLMDGMLAETTALHGRLTEARALFDRAEAAADDPYAITVWASLAARTAAIAGDPVWALHAADQGIAADPGFTYVFLGTYQRLARCWALAVTGRDPRGAAAEARRLIDANLLDPIRTCVSTWHGLLGEMLMAAGDLDAAAEALDRADQFLDTHGQRYAEGLILLLRARLSHARGAPADVVRAAAERARALAVEREAHLFATRADEFLAALQVSLAQGVRDGVGPVSQPEPDGHTV
ncbi:BTAD domain-containing putative transcriptional regulator [Actinoplanes rectilineatus]|uniref:BTAD domain-containing putative transcriptional regulator n=1 Tax=Actinoplanes rectilineatus TaxID=113571 RepID=UPI000ABDE3BC|nr:BTAD domain-containing putative transcriptional regulator [Actinoplanes rectilineatus]